MLFPWVYCTLAAGALAACIVIAVCAEVAYSRPSLSQPARRLFRHAAYLLVLAAVCWAVAALATPWQAELEAALAAMAVSGYAGIQARRGLLLARGEPGE